MLILSINTSGFLYSTFSTVGIYAKYALSLLPSAAYIYIGRL